jgi:hypothetical protein
MLRVRDGCVLIAAQPRCENPQGIDSKRGAEGEVDERDDAKDDCEDTSPGLAREQGPAGENDASDADHEGEQRHRPEAVHPHSTERAPAEIEVRMPEVTAKETVEEHDANHSSEGAQHGVDEPKGRQALKIAGDAVVRYAYGHRAVGRR